MQMEAKGLALYGDFRSQVSEQKCEKEQSKDANQGEPLLEGAERESITKITMENEM